MPLNRAWHLRIRATLGKKPVGTASGACGIGLAASGGSCRPVERGSVEWSAGAQHGGLEAVFYAGATAAAEVGQQSLEEVSAGGTDTDEHDGDVYRAIATKRDALSDREVIHWYH